VRSLAARVKAPPSTFRMAVAGCSCGAARPGRDGAQRKGGRVSEHGRETPPRVERLSTREGYERWAAIYDAEDNPLIALEEPRVVDLLGDARGLDVADLGCGTGRHTVRLAMGGARVTAVDFSDAMVARATGKPGWGQVRFLAHDLTRPLPLTDASFDRVLSCLVLEHLEDVGSFFAECRRICRPRGFVLVSAMHPAMMLRGIQARFVDPATGVEVRPASHAATISDYVMAALGAGLSIDHLSEHAVGDELATPSPRAAKYLGWPMLFLMRLRPA
jgi:malonyl-CoA O-methyltransferase